MTAISLNGEEILAETLKQYPVLYHKQCKGYKEKDAVGNAWATVANQLEFVENGEDKPVYRHYHQFKIIALCNVI